MLDAASEPTLAEAPSDSCNRTGGHLQRFGRTVVGPGRTFRPFVHLQQNANARLLGCWAFPTLEAFEEIGALLFGQFNPVFLVGHDTSGRVFKGRFPTICQTKIRDSYLTVSYRTVFRNKE